MQEIHNLVCPTYVFFFFFVDDDSHGDYVYRKSKIF